MSRTRPASGFTLLEIVLAMTVASMLALTLYTALRVCIIASRSASADMADIRDAGAAMDQMASDLASALPSGGELVGPFIGTSNLNADQADFFIVDVAPTANQAKPMAGVMRVNWSLENQSSGVVLRRRMVRSLVANIEPPAQDEAFCRNVQALTLRYYDGTTWRTAWDSEAESDALPTAVEITLETVRTEQRGAGANRRWTRIVRLAFAPPSSQSSSGGTP